MKTDIRNKLKALFEMIIDLLGNETKINMALAILFAILTLMYFVGAVFCAAWWHFYALLLSAGLVWVTLTARDDSGDSAWKHIKNKMQKSAKPKCIPFEINKKKALKIIALALEKSTREKPVIMHYYGFYNGLEIYAIEMKADGKYDFDNRLFGETICISEISCETDRKFNEIEQKIKEL